MFETPLVQGRAEWPIPVRRTRKRRRESRAIPYHTSRPSPRNSPPAASPPRGDSRQNDQSVIQDASGQSNNFQFLELYDFQPSLEDDLALRPIIHQDGQNKTNGNHSPNHYTLSPSSSSYSQVLHSNHTPLQDGNMLQFSANDIEMSWTNATVMVGDVGQDIDSFSMSDIVGSFGSFDSMMLATPETGTSSISGEYGFPAMDSIFESPLDGLKLPGRLI